MSTVILTTVQIALTMFRARAELTFREHDYSGLTMYERLKRNAKWATSTAWRKSPHKGDEEEYTIECVQTLLPEVQRLADEYDLAQATGVRVA